MIDLILLCIRSFGSFLGMYLNLEIPITDGVSIYMRDFFILIFILIMFVKFFKVITNNSVHNTK